MPLPQSPAVIAFDADDTLWHNESFFKLTEARFAELLAPYCEKNRIEERLVAAERRNVHHYGYGIKGFILSMIETAIEVTDSKVPATVIGEILTAGQDMLGHPVEPLDGVREALAAIRGIAPLILITKGDLFDQERKIAASGLQKHFTAVDVVSEKSPEVYARIFARYTDDMSKVVMIGNSVRSDILPVLELGATAIHVPYPLLWALEAADFPVGHPKAIQLKSLTDLPALFGRT